MIKTSNEVRTLVSDNQFLRWGLSHRLFNLSQLAEYIKPLLEARTKKTLQTGAIVMNLSRMQKLVSKYALKKHTYHVGNINVYSNLRIMTFRKDPEVRHNFGNSYLSITEGVHEVTVIVEAANREQFLKNVKPKKEFSDVAAVSIQFSAQHSETPGFLHFLLQLLTLQNINILEVSSTFTEIVFYMHSKDVKLAFDTFYSSLM
ncbi:hypothetical protein KBD59_02235 [Candidatus Gracilibacteria bacterium]|nr:hypothetical protein [Candidatus Gracilibacteria bacterium]